MEFKKERLQALKRAELQKLCKEFGIKANMKTAKLIEALICYSGIEENTANVAETEMSADHDCCESNEEKQQSTQVMKEPENKNSNLQIKTSCKEKEKTSNVKLDLVSAVASKIPRLTKPSKKVDCSIPNNTTTNSKTPKQAKNWSKIHQKQFAKMDSLDVYLEKKRKRAEQLGCSDKKVKSMTTPKLGRVAERKTRLAFQFSKQTSNKENTTAADQQKQKTPIGVTSTNKGNLKRKRASTESEETGSEVKKIKSNYATPKFQPAVGKEKRLTFNFSKTTKENAVTPGKLRRRATFGASKGTNDGGQKAATPFRFSAGLQSPTPRKTFDLKASLSKPLAYKPYTGKLPTQPYVKHNSKTASVKKTSREKDMKAVKVTSRKDRRDQILKNKSKRRDNGVSKRRRMVDENME